jgi:predicted RecB family nuclease
VADLDTAGSVTHYTPYERTQLRALARAVPECAAEIEAIIDRLFDLEPVIRQNMRHPRAAGRSSIKAVLPAWCPDCSYEGLEIADGQTASVRCLRVLTGVADAGEAEATYAALREYCGLDTWAMVRLLQEMQRLADASA